MKKKILYLWGLFIATILTPPISVQAQSWTASAPADGGTYFLYNVGKQAFLCSGYDWGTRATLTREGGMSVTLVSKGDGTYYISTAPTYPNRFLGYDGYVDKASDDGSNYCSWTFSAVSGQTNTYTLKEAKNNKYWLLGRSTTDENGFKTDRKTDAPSDSYGYWKLVSRADYIQWLTDNASASNPLDATLLLTNPNFSASTSGSGWTNPPSIGGVAKNQCGEQYNKTFDTYQTITGVPNGVYTMKIQGFYRLGAADNAASKRNAGQEDLNATYYINGMEHPLMSIFDDDTHLKTNNGTYNTSSAVTVNGTDYYVPSDKDRATSCFHDGDYENTPIRVVVSDGTITLGVKKSVAVEKDWTIFDNVRLTYYGIDIDEAIAEWHSKYDDIVDQAYDRGNYDDLLNAANVSAQCTDEASLNAYDATVWQAVCDVLKDDNNASVQFDITSLIQNPNFDTDASGWANTRTVGYNSTYHLAEYFGKDNGSLTQTLANMPAGTYTLKAQAFFRSRAWREASAAYQNGTDEVKGSLVLGNTSTPVLNIYDQPRYQPAYISGNVGGTKQKMVPNSMHAADAAFDIGQYWNQVTTTTTNVGDLTLGLNIAGGLSNNWLCFDNFRLYYGTTAVPVDLTQGLPTEDTQATTVTTGINLTAGTYNKVCLPFDLDATQTAAVFTAAYTLAGVTADGVGQLVPVSTIEAGKAYFVTVDATKTLTVSNVMVKVAQPDSIPVMWEGAATVGTFNGFTFTVNRTDGVATDPTYTPVDWQNMSFTVNQENWRARRFLSEVTYTSSSTDSKIGYFNEGQPTPLDQPHSVFIPVPQNNSALTVTVSKQSDYSDAETFDFAAGTTLCEVPNLMPQTTYYYKVEDGGSTLTKGQFQTTGHLRMIKVNTGFNVRDLGGWETLDGNRLKYGKIFRGGELNIGHTVSAADLAELCRLGMAAELDFRRDDDCNGSSPTTSVLTGSETNYLYLNQDYSDDTNFFEVDKALYKRAFNFTLNNLQQGRGVYFHCRVGADRTGAYALLIGGLCGMTFDQLCKDYELTSYSEADTRKWNTGINDKLDYINELPGNTLQQKFFYYMNTELEIPAADLLDFIDIMVDGESSITNAPLAFNNADNEYLQAWDDIAAICPNGSTVVSNAKAQLSDGTTTTDVTMSIDAIAISFAGAALATGKTYTLTIPAGSIEKGGTQNAEAVTLTFKTPIVFDGDYYLYNEAHDQFLSRNRNYGTRGVLDNFGVPATFTTDKDNITTIKFLDNNLYYGAQDGYTDNSATGNILWTLEPTSDGAFLLFLNNGINKYVTMNYDNTYKYWFNRVREKTHSEYIETPFVVKTLAEYNAIIERKKTTNILAAATAAGINTSTLSEFQTALASCTSTPLSGIIKSADAGSKDDWVLSEPWARNESENNYNIGDYGAELYLKNGSVSQTVTVPHAGLYKLTLNAFIRQGTAANCCAAGYKGFKLSNAFVSINDTYYAQVPDWFSDRRSDDSPGTTTRFKSMTDDDSNKYMMEVYAYIDDTKTATITLSVPGYVPAQWCIFNNWKLTEIVPNVTLSDENTTAPAAYPYANVTLNRTLKHGVWNTFCVPFDMEKPSGWEVRELTGTTQNNDNISLIFEPASSISAGVPYMVRFTGDDNITSLSQDGVAISSTINRVEKTDIDFVGTYAKQTLPTGSFFIQNNTFYQVGTGNSVNMKGYRAYLMPKSNSVKAVSYVVYDEATVIGDIDTDNVQSTMYKEVYDLQGRRISVNSALPKGIYIVNGKKVLVK